MLKNLKMTNVGPAPTMELALTRKWPAQVNGSLTSGKKALPSGPGEASIAFSVGTTTGDQYVSRFDRLDQAWTGRPGRPANPGLVLYAMADGSFAVWDPARNYWRTGNLQPVQAGRVRRLQHTVPSIFPDSHRSLHRGRYWISTPRQPLQLRAQIWGQTGNRD